MSTSESIIHALLGTSNDAQLLQKPILSLGQLTLFLNTLKFPQSSMYNKNFSALLAG